VQYSVPFIQINLGKITSWVRNANNRDQDVVIFVETRRDRDETLVSSDRLKTETLSPRPHPWFSGLILNILCQAWWS